jgi:hypothetical protein
MRISRSAIWIPVCAVAIVCLGLALPAHADTVFTDGTMDLTNYTTVGPVATGPVVVTDETCSSPCGNPGSALEINFAYSGAASAQVGFVNNTFTYAPSAQGDITSITASVDKNLTSTATAGNTFHPTIEQDGIFYIASIAGPGLSGATGGTTGYNTLSSALDAADFLEYDFSTGVTGTANPNFDGDLMLFGLTQISSNMAGQENLTAYYDNLSFDIASTPVATPEPSGLLLLTSGLAGLIGFSRRKLRLT